jgi:hypothetical protein
MRSEEDELRRREHEHVATELGISVETLGRHSYTMDDGYSFNGAYMTWRVLWQDQPPEGVATEGLPGALWTDIMAMTSVKED